ncbi:MAG TPA: LytR C-terminal domain-containing protein [Candidatus Limnocylindrales bacterium]|nr:LytR C-terminal domain-containing protein [Candidatus Limnocylindrales bacterium]
MKKNHASTENNNSLKTFFVYFIIVALIVGGALVVRSFFILSQSRFDGSNITVAVSQNKKIVSIIGVDSSKKIISILKTDKVNIPLDNLAAKLGLISESYIDSVDYLDANSTDTFFLKSINVADGIRSDLTIFDKIRLWFISKNVSENNIKKENITALTDKILIDQQIKTLFTDSNLVSENLSIQIINSTEIPGLGQNLERVILNRGGNVVSVSSSRSKSPNSIIDYFVRNSYTSNKLHKILRYPLKKTDSKTIADIVIIIGEDYKKYSGL